MLDKFFSISSRTQGHVTVKIDDCLTALATMPTDHFDAIITDPPYEIGLHGKQWDDTGIAFSAPLWEELHRVIKPGGFVAAFAASRLYHRLALAAETSGFRPYPMLLWKFPLGLPKPINVSSLFERESNERIVVGSKGGAGYTRANVAQGAQGRQTWQWPVYGPPVTPNGKQWQGYYYGVNTVRPSIEPIFLGQKSPSGEMKENILRHRTGALNVGAYQARHGHWPEAILEHGKAKHDDHGSDHPSVKPIGLMQDLCLLCCPRDGHILDCFGGTGTTGVAASREGMACTLIEADSQWLPVIQARLPQATIMVE